MLKFEVENFMGCQKANVETSQISFICGLNHQGKSSFLTAVSGALTGQPVVLGLRKTDLGMLVYTGKASGKVKIENEDSSVSVTYPKAELLTEGENPPTTSKIAAGMESLIDFSEKKRSEFIRNLTECVPSKTDLEEFLAERFITKKNVVEAVWQKVDQDGFDASLERAKDTGRALKQQWSMVTGETYGSNKAQTWQPQGWTSDLVDVSEESLQADLTGLQAELENLISHQAIDENELTKLRETASDSVLAQLKIDRDKTITDLAMVRKSFYEFKREFDELPKYDESGKKLCPHCGKPLIIKGGELAEFIEPSAEEKTAVQKKRTELSEKMQKADIEVKRLESLYAVSLSKVEETEKANKRLYELERKSSGNASQRDIDLKREEIRKQQEGIAAFKAAKEAKRLAQNIIENQAIIDALDMSGIRQKSMLKGLQIFNAQLSEICNTAGWGTVKIDNDLTILMGDRPYILLSESEKMRCRITLQMAVAIMQDDKIVIIDGAEILDKNGKSGLLNLLYLTHIDALIGMMCSDPAKAPRVDDCGIRSYWANNGVFELIKD